MILIIALVLLSAGCGPKSYVVLGKVTGVNGEPLAGVTIISKGKVNAEVRTDVKGEWKLAGLKGSTTLEPYMANRAFKPARQIVVKAAENVNFAAQFPLVVKMEGKGTVSYHTETGPLTNAPSEEGYKLGERVTLTATPLEGWKFSNWSDDWNGAKPSFSIVMDGPKQVTVKFVQGNAIILFEDPSLEHVVRKAINKPLGSITREDVETLTHLNASVTSIHSLKGIENLLGLSWLDLSVTDTAAIGELASLTRLGYLNLDSNRIVDISALGKLLELSELRLNNNKIADITSLAWLANKNLTKADLGNNQIANISALRNLTTLQTLNLGNNQIVDITPLSNLKEMRELDLSANLIDKIDAVVNMRKLEKLNMRKNKLVNTQNIVWLKDSDLTELNLSENLIADISKIGMLTNLVKLNLANNKIVNIDALSTMTNLQELNISNNQVADISALANLKRVEKLFLHRNVIADIQPLLAMPALKEVTLMDNELNLSTGLSAHHVIQELGKRNVLVRFDYYQNDAPIIKYPDVDTMTINEAQELKFTVVAVDPNQDEMTFEATGGLKNYFDPLTRVFAWTPGYNDAGVHDVTFVVKDSETVTTKKLTITVNNVNRPPVFTPAIGNKTVDETKTLAFTIHAVDPDGDAVTYAVDDSPLRQYFDMKTLTFTWTPTYEEAGTYQMTFRATDGDKESAETITIAVNNVNRTPVLHPISDKTVDEMTLLEFTISGEDPDKEDTLVYSAEGPFSDKFDPEKRTFSWTPTYEQAGVYTITFKVSDGRLSASQAVKITVNNVDRAPVFDQMSEQRIDEYSVLKFTIRAVDPDGDSVVYSSANLPAKATLNATTGEFIWMPTRDHIGLNEVTFVATAKNKTTSMKVSILVNDVAFAPELTKIGDRVVNEGQILKFTVEAIDKDGDKPTYRVEGDYITQYFNAANNTFEWTPDYNVTNGLPKVFTITFFASDGIHEVSETIKITVNNTNRPPDIIVMNDQWNVNENQQVQFQIAVSDADGDQVSLVVGGPLASYYNMLTQTFTWTPGWSDAGQHKVTFIANDGKASTTKDIVIIVNNVDRPPIFQIIEPKTIQIDEYQNYTLQLIAHDPDDEPINYTASNLPVGATLNAKTGLFSWTPDYTHANKEFVVTFSVGFGISQTVTFKVRDLAFPPEFTSPIESSFIVNEDELISFQVQAKDKDNDPVTYDIAFPDNPVKYTQEVKDKLTSFFNRATNMFQWRPSYDEATSAGPVSYTIRFKASDGNVLNDVWKEVTITIINVDREPQFTVTPQNVMVKDGGMQVMDLSVMDLDGEPITLTVDNPPAGSSFSIISNTVVNGVTTTTAKLSWNPTAENVGDHFITFTAVSGSKTVKKTVLLTVQGSRLLITYLTIDQVSIKPGQSTTLRTEIKNGGNVVTGQFMAKWEILAKDQDGNWVLYRQLNSTPNIGPLGINSSQLINYTLSADDLRATLLPYGEYWVRMTVDPTGSQGGPVSKEVRFILERPQYLLTVNVSGGGTVLKSPTSTASTYPEDTVVKLTPIPHDGWLFERWEGDPVVQVGADYTITMAGNRTVTAVFKKIQLPYQMAFLSKRDDSSRGDIFVMDMDSTLTKIQTNSLIEGAPKWFYRTGIGAQLLFEGNSGTRRDIYLVNANGTGLTNLTNGGFTATQFISPAWSPTGEKIAFAAKEYGNFDIFVMNLNTRAVQRMTLSSIDDDTPIWAPDESFLVCVDKNGSLLKIDVSDPVNIAPVSLNGGTAASVGKNPVWSPDGHRIAFEANNDIYMIEFLTNTPKPYTQWIVYRVTTSPANDHSPSWSPDSRTLTFISDRTGSDDIYALAGSFKEAEGLAVRLSTTDLEDESEVSWSPDGSKLIYVSEVSGTKEIFMMSPSGADVVRLTTNNVDDYAPAWATR